MICFSAYSDLCGVEAMAAASNDSVERSAGNKHHAPGSPLNTGRQKALKSELLVE